MTANMTLTLNIISYNYAGTAQTWYLYNKGGRSGLSNLDCSRGEPFPESARGKSLL